MSFSYIVKSEITKNTDISRDEILSMISAIMKVSGTLSFSSSKLSFKIKTENPSTARFVFKLLKDHLNIHGKLMVKRSSSLKKNNVYIIIINEDMGLRKLLVETGIMKDDQEVFSLDYSIQKMLVRNDALKKAYIKGSFLGSGSVSNPEKAYHLEFVTSSQEHAEDLMGLINSYGLSAKVISRKNSFIVYLKEGEQIVDILSIIGAFNSLFEFENVRIVKDMRNNVNRIVNCETANLSKTVNAAVRQVESIRLIEKELGLARLSKPLREIAEMRLDYPDESLKELGEMLDPPVGKSGVNHRLRKIEKIADELRKGGI
ncbi:MAG: DNA-binding protein WhiA [Clostridiaceae bacterium]